MSSGGWTEKTMLNEWAVESACASLIHVAFFVKKDASDLVPFAAVASFFAAAEIGFSALRCDEQGNQEHRERTTEKQTSAARSARRRCRAIES